MKTIFDKLPSEATKHDRLRAGWRMRYLRFVPEDLFPEACKDLKTESDLRWDFIFKPPFGHKPLGFANGMCGRPMNAHYLDNLKGEQYEKRKQWKMH